MKLVILFGPPAVGKMTVGQQLANLTGFKLLHNHMTIELALNFFAFNTKEFSHLNSLFRREIFSAVAASELPGLIFTYVWALNEPSDKTYVDGITKPFLDHGATVYYIELQADLPTRLKRNKEPSRLEQKPSKRDLASSEARLLQNDKVYQFNTSGARPFFQTDNYIKIDNTNLQAAAVAAMIKERFGL